MRPLIVSEFVTIDGVMEAPGGEPGFRHSGWVFHFPFDPAQAQYKLQEVRDADALLLGRVTYDGFSAAWPARDDPEGFAAKMNAMPKHVVTSTRDHLEWNNSHVLAGDDVAGRVAALKETPGGPILVAGSRTLVHALYEADLVDEWRLMTFPIVLGSGARLFPEDAEAVRPLRLVDTLTFPNGVIVYTYHPSRRDQAGSATTPN